VFNDILLVFEAAKQGSECMFKLAFGVEEQAWCILVRDHVQRMSFTMQACYMPHSHILLEFE